MKVTAYRFYSASGNATDSIGVIPPLLIDPNLADGVARLLSASNPSGDTKGLLRIDFVWRWYVDLDQALSEEFRPAFTALLEALRQLKEPCAIDLYSDSQYVINGLEKGWAKGWRARGWKKADKSPALNPDLWAPLLEESEKHKITYHWLKGHAGHPENERCDRMAVEQSKKYGGRQA